LHGLQLVLEKKGLEWTSNFTTHDPDPFQTHTAIGDIGTLKPSGRIIFRVTPDTRRSAPALLRESTYNRYLSPIWVAMEPDFKPLKPQPDKRTWKISEETAPGRTITVAASLHKGKGLLKLPDGVFQIDRLPVVSLEKSKYGTLKVDGGPGIVDYRVHFVDGGLEASPPTEIDLDIPEKEKPALDSIRNQLQLEGMSPREILKRVESFFLNEFEYSLTQQDVGRKQSPLSHFLLQSRAGHCEYFATATVLLLRAAGIPARYCRGYAVQEFSKLENRFIVRDRHAHAWTLVYVDGIWTNFDTTPGSWMSVENAAAPRWQVLSDLWSWCKFKLSGAWWWLRQSPAFGYLWWLVLPVILIPARRLFHKNRIQRAEQRPLSPIEQTLVPAGTDSEFYQIEKTLTKAGHGRRSAETLRRWIRRLAREQSSPRLQDDLNSILNLHYRYRFDPLGISASEKAALETGVQAWLSAYHKSEQAP
jgi:transglutaminase-like putative cysteine protease